MQLWVAELSSGCIAQLKRVSGSGGAYMWGLWTHLHCRTGHWVRGTQQGKGLVHMLAKVLAAA